MTVSAGVGGGSVVGVVLGGGAVAHGGGAFTGGGGAVTGNSASAPERVADVVRTLPFTGASHLELLIAIALVLLVVGSLAVGLSRRAGDDALVQPS